MIQFLQAFQNDGLLSLDRARGQWTFRLDELPLRPRPTTSDLDDAADPRLSPSAQAVLRLAACIGGPFSWKTFLTATDHTWICHKPVWPSVDRRSHSAGRWPVRRRARPRPGAESTIHPRPAPEGRYGLIPENQRAAVHVGVGRELLAECGSDVPEERLFEIVNHLTWAVHSSRVPASVRSWRI